MATITVAYLAVSGNAFTPGDFNGIWAGATITLSDNEVTTAKIIDDAVTRDKIAANVAGSGLAQATDGSLVVIGDGGYTSTALAGSNVALVRLTNTRTQRFTGTTSAAIDIAASTTGANAGDKFDLYFVNVVVSASFTLSIKSGSTALYVFNLASTLNGKLSLMYTGSAWEICENHVRINES